MKTEIDTYFDEKLIEKNVYAKKQNQAMYDNINNTAIHKLNMSTKVDNEVGNSSKIKKNIILERKKAPLVLNIGLKTFKSLLRKEIPNKPSADKGEHVAQILFKQNNKKTDQSLLESGSKPSLDNMSQKKYYIPQNQGKIPTRKISHMLDDRMAVQNAQHELSKSTLRSRVVLPIKDNDKDRVSLNKMVLKVQEASKNIMGGEKTYILNQYNKERNISRTIAKRMIYNKEHIFTSDAITQLIGEQNYQIVLAAISNNDQETKTRAICALLTENAPNKDSSTQTDIPDTTLDFEMPSILKKRYNNVNIEKVPHQRRRNARIKGPYVVKDPPKYRTNHTEKKHRLEDISKNVLQNITPFNILDGNAEVLGCNTTLAQGSVCSEMTFSLTPSILDCLNHLKPVLEKVTPCSPEQVYKETINVDTFGKKLQVNIGSHKNITHSTYEDHLPKLHTQNFSNASPKASSPFTNVHVEIKATNYEKTTSDLNRTTLVTSQIDNTTEKDQTMSMACQNISSNSQSWRQSVQLIKNDQGILSNGQSFQNKPDNMRIRNTVNTSTTTRDCENNSCVSLHDNALIMNKNAKVMWSSTITNSSKIADNTSNFPRSPQSDVSSLQDINYNQNIQSSPQNMKNDAQEIKKTSENRTENNVTNHDQNISQQDQYRNTCLELGEISGLDDPDFLSKLKSEDPLNLVTPELMNMLSDKEKTKLVNLQMEMDWKLCIETVNERYLPIHMAVLEDNLSLLKRQCMALKARNESVDMGDVKQNLSALHLSVMESSNLKCVKILLEHGANPLERDDDDKTVLHHCTKPESEEHLNFIISYMVGNPAKILQIADLWDDSTKNMNEEEMGHYLLKYAVEMDDISGFTPTMEMSRLGLHSHLFILLGQLSEEQAKRAVNRRNRTSGNTALHLAILAASISSENNRSVVPEEYASTIEVLLKFGADLYAENYSKTSAISFISENEFPPGMNDILFRKVTEFQLAEKSYSTDNTRYMNCLTKSNAKRNSHVFEDTQDSLENDAKNIVKKITELEKGMKTNETRCSDDNIFKVFYKSGSGECLPKISCKVLHDLHSNSINLMDEGERANIPREIVQKEDMKSNNLIVRENKNIIDTTPKEFRPELEKNTIQTEQNILKNNFPPNYKKDKEKLDFVSSLKLGSVKIVPSPKVMTVKNIFNVFPANIRQENTQIINNIVSSINEPFPILQNTEPTTAMINKNNEKDSLVSPNVIRIKVLPVTPERTIDNIPVANSSKKNIQILSDIAFPKTVPEKNWKDDILSSKVNMLDSKKNFPVPTTNNMYENSYKDFISSNFPIGKLRLVDEKNQRVSHMSELDLKRRSPNSTDKIINTLNVTLSNTKKQFTRENLEKPDRDDKVDIVSIKKPRISKKKSNVLGLDVTKVIYGTSITDTTPTQSLKNVCKDKEKDPPTKKPTTILPSEMVKEIYRTSLGDSQSISNISSTSGTNCSHNKAEKPITTKLNTVESYTRQINRSDVLLSNSEKNENSKVNLNTLMDQIGTSEANKTKSNKNQETKSLIIRQKVGTKCLYNIVESNSNTLSQEVVDKSNILPFEITENNYKEILETIPKKVTEKEYHSSLNVIKVKPESITSSSIETVGFSTKNSNVENQSLGKISKPLLLSEKINNVDVSKLNTVEDKSEQNVENVVENITKKRSRKDILHNKVDSALTKHKKQKLDVLSRKKVDTKNNTNSHANKTYEYFSSNKNTFIHSSGSESDSDNDDDSNELSTQKIRTSASESETRIDDINYKPSTYFLKKTSTTKPVKKISQKELSPKKISRNRVRKTPKRYSPTLETVKKISNRRQTFNI